MDVLCERIQPQTGNSLESLHAATPSTAGNNI